MAKLLTEFCIKGSPSTVTAQQKGLRIVNGHAQFYEKKNVTEAKTELKYSMKRYVPACPFEGDLYVRILWCYCKQTLKKNEAFTFKRSRPDLDNLSKSVLDCMTDLGMWIDDSQVVKLDLTKAWNIKYPGLYIQIWQLDEGDYYSFVEDWRGI